MRNVLMRLWEDLMEYAVIVALFAFTAAVGISFLGNALKFDELVTSLTGLAGSVFHWATLRWGNEAVHAAARRLERGNGLSVAFVNDERVLNRTLGIDRIGNTGYEEVDGKWALVLEPKDWVCAVSEAQSGAAWTGVWVAPRWIYRAESSTTPAFLLLNE
jgi:Flp pilus assembly pilin Flp